jgi:hypothetical protein
MSPLPNPVFRATLAVIVIGAAKLIGALEVVIEPPIDALATPV